MNRTLLPIGNWAKGFRVVAACITGMFVAFILLVAIEFFSSIVHPVPPDFGGTKDEMCQHVARYPHWMLTLVVPLWGITAFVSTWTAERIGGRGAALFIGLLLVAAVVFNVWQLPYPSPTQVRIKPNCGSRCNRTREEKSARAGGGGDLICLVAPEIALLFAGRTVVK